jgi:hypothetical protein
MDGHPSGVPQGPGGQNPAYRPAHRHLRRLTTRAFIQPIFGWSAFAGASTRSSTSEGKLRSSRRQCRSVRLTVFRLPTTHARRLRACVCVLCQETGQWPGIPPVGMVCPTEGRWCDVIEAASRFRARRCSEAEEPKGKREDLVLTVVTRAYRCPYRRVQYGTGAPEQGVG